MYASSESDANMRYATCFSAPDPFIFVRTAAGRRHLFMSDLEIDRARDQSNAHAVHPVSDYLSAPGGRARGAPRIAAVIAAILWDLRIRGVTVPANFPVGVADDLRDRGVSVRAVDDPFFPERLCKTPAEIAEIKKALRATEKGIRAAIGALRRTRIRGGFLVYEGRRLTAETLRGIINTTVLVEGYLPAHTIVAPGRQSCDPHDFGSGPIRANEPIIIDVFPRSESSGYFGDITRTVVRGKASDEVKRMYRAVRAGQRLGLRSIRHGVDGRDVHGAIVKLFEERGFPTRRGDGRMQGFFHSTGHGLGLDLHEPPRVGPNRTILEKGMVITVEPGLYYHPHGGVRIEDTVLVTRTAIENLTRLPKFLEI